MTLVLDASIGYDLLTARTAASKLARATELLAPDLIVAELFNVRWKVERSGMDAPSLERVLGFLRRLRIVPSLPYAEDAATLAEHLVHPVYDCLYVALAQRHRAKFLTLDERMARKLREHRLGQLLH